MAPRALLAPRQLRPSVLYRVEFEPDVTFPAHRYRRTRFANTCVCHELPVKHIITRADKLSAARRRRHRHRSGGISHHAMPFSRDFCGAESLGTDAIWRASGPHLDPARLDTGRRSGSTRMSGSAPGFIRARSVKWTFELRDFPRYRQAFLSHHRLGRLTPLPPADLFA